MRKPHLEVISLIQPLQWLSALLAFVLLAAASAAAEVPLPAFPAELTDHNTKISFEVDSTWHMVHGTTAGVDGSVRLADPADESSVRADLSLPVSKFDTGNSMRDRKMREVLQADSFPKVSYRLLKMESPCDRSKSAPGDSCQATLQGEITIRDVTRPISAPVTLTSSAEAMKIQGETSLQWPDFGVEDPSILVARVHKQVNIKFEVELPYQK